MRSVKDLVFALALGSTVGAAAKDLTLAELKSQVESAHPADRPPLCIRIAQHQLRNADQLYKEGNVEQASVAVEDVVTYSGEARDAATQSRKHMKNVEISVRKMAEKLRDIKRTLNLEDQTPIDAAIKQLEDIRTTLLSAMFSKEKK